jgi:hypothetical protein
MRSPVALVTALVCAANLAALGRGAYNRSAVEAEHTLSSRELQFADPGEESTVTTVRLTWVHEGPLVFRRDAAERAGFDCSVPPDDSGADRFYARQLQREAYVALEYEGPAWQRYRQSQEERLKELGSTARPQVAGTRLVAVDVDRDARALRRRHPDRSRYVISRARMRVYVTATPEVPPRRVIVASISQLIPSVLNVPRPLSGTLRELMRRADARANRGPDDPRYRVTLRYGRSYEPWIVAVHE